MKTLIFCFVLLLATANSAYSMGWRPECIIFGRSCDDHGTNNNPAPNNNPGPGTVAVPDPSPILLLASGLFGLWIIRKKLTRNQEKGGKT